MVARDAFSKYKKQAHGVSRADYTGNAAPCGRRHDARHGREAARNIP
jgi:hypothetical protein